MVAQRCDERGELVTSRITVLGVQSGLRSDNAVIRLDYDPSGASDCPGI